MDKRFILALAGFILVVGAGGAWLAFNLYKRKKLLRNLLSLPKERRFFWYKLRQIGFTVLDFDYPREFSFQVDGQDRKFALKVDFLLSRGGRRFAGVFMDDTADAEALKLYSVFRTVFGVNGVVFYSPFDRRLTVWES